MQYLIWVRLANSLIKQLVILSSNRCILYRKNCLGMLAFRSSHIDGNCITERGQQHLKATTTARFDSGQVLRERHQPYIYLGLFIQKHI